MVEPKYNVNIVTPKIAVDTIAHASPFSAANTTSSVSAAIAIPIPIPCVNIFNASSPFVLGRSQRNNPVARNARKMRAACVSRFTAFNFVLTCFFVFVILICPLSFAGRDSLQARLLLNTSPAYLCAQTTPHADSSPHRRF